MRVALFALGWRFATGRRQGHTTQSALLFVGVVVATAITLIACAAPGAVQAQRDRAAALTLSYGASDSKVRGLDLSYTDRRFNGAQIKRVLIGVEPGSQPGLKVPGIARLPAPGHVYISPALAKRAQTDAAAAALLSHNDVVGRIGAAGLTQPHELRAIVGVDWNSAALQPVNKVGIDSTGNDPNAVLNDFLPIVILIVVGTQSIALVVLCTRLGSRQRRQAIYGLRALGVSNSGIKTVFATSALVIAVPAIVTAGILFQLIVSNVTQVPGTLFGFASGDLRLPLGYWAAAVVLIISIVWFAARLGVRSATDRENRKTHRSRSGRSIAGGAVALAGFVALFGSRILPPGIVVGVAQWLGIALLATGTSLLAPWLIAITSRLPAKFCNRGGWLVGFKINIAEPGTVARLAAAMAVTILGLIGALGLINMLTGGTNARTAEASGTSILRVSDFGDELTLGRLRSFDGVKGAVPEVTLAGDKGDVATVVATCAQLRPVLDTALPDCANDRRMWLSRTGADARVERSTSIKIPDSRRARLPDRAQALATGKTDLFDGILFAPDLVSTNVAMSPRFIVAVNAESASTIMAGISSAAPAVGFFFGSQYAADVDSQEYSTQITWLAMTLAVALFIAWLAMCVSAIGESFARRDQLRGLHLLGAGQRDVIRAYGASLLLPLLVVPAFAIAIGVVINFQAAIYDDRAMISAQAFILIFAVSAILATATWLLTLQNVLRADRG